MLFSRIKTKNKILLAVIFAVFLFVGLILFLRMSEDDWICQNGGWVKHGNPSSSIPTSTCK